MNYFLIIKEKQTEQTADHNPKTKLVKTGTIIILS